MLDLTRARMALVMAEGRRDATYQMLEYDARKAFSLKLATEARNLIQKWHENPADHHLLRTSSLAIQALIEPWEKLKALTLQTDYIADWNTVYPCFKAEGHAGMTGNPSNLGWSLMKCANPSDYDNSSNISYAVQSASIFDQPLVRDILTDKNNSRLPWTKCKAELIKLVDKHLCILENQLQQALEAEAIALEDFIAAYTTKEARDCLKHHQAEIRTLTVRFNQILRMFHSIRNQSLRKSNRGKSSSQSSGSSSSGSQSSGSQNSGSSGATPKQPKNNSPEIQPENTTSPELQFNNIIPDFNSNATDHETENTIDTTEDVIDNTPAPEPMKPGEAKKLESRILIGFTSGVTDDQMARFFAGWEDWRMQYSDDELQKFLSNIQESQAVERYKKLFQA
ncbi:MAG: hypothetical protein ACKO85_07695 [Isosphaeraceae bacterium]